MAQRVWLQEPSLWSYVWKSASVCLALLQQTWRNGRHGSHRLCAGRADQWFRQEETKVSCVPQLKCKCVWDPVPVGPVYGAARAHICEERRNANISNNFCFGKPEKYNKQKEEYSQSVVEAGPYLYFTPYAEYRAVTALWAADSWERIYRYYKIILMSHRHRHKQTVLPRNQS